MMPLMLKGLNGALETIKLDCLLLIPFSQLLEV